MALRLRISGIVQGVGYRAAFADQAHALGLSGWVRNRRDGSVEALICGSTDAMEAICTWARRGPPQALVRELAIEEISQEFAADGFSIHPTQ
jgi:acylphosphatase